MALSDHVITGIVNVSTQELLQQSMNMFPLFYITAVVNASQFVPDHRMRYILGAGDNTTDAEGHVFHNREVKIDFTYLFRVFSINSTSEVLSLFYSTSLNVCIIFRMKYQLLQTPRKFWVSVHVLPACH